MTTTPAHLILEPRPPLTVRDAYRLTLKVLTAAGCAYEIAALPARSPLPTITSITGRSWHWRRPYGPFVFVLAAAGSVVHFVNAVRMAGTAAKAAHDVVTDA